jgi:hypothetical protein
MNNERMKRLTLAYAELMAILDEEGEAFENKPEPFQYAERGNCMREGIEALAAAVDALEPLCS